MADAKTLPADAARRLSVEGVIVGALWSMAALGLAGLAASALIRFDDAGAPAQPVLLGAMSAAAAGGAFLGYRNGARRGR
jgi:hypothetical protein